MAPARRRGSDARREAPRPNNPIQRVEIANRARRSGVFAEAARRTCGAQALVPPAPKQSHRLTPPQNGPAVATAHTGSGTAGCLWLVAAPVAMQSTKSAALSQLTPSTSGRVCTLVPTSAALICCLQMLPASAIRVAPPAPLIWTALWLELHYW
jgi:hypothetical protein